MWTVLVHAGTLKSGLRLSHNLTEGYCGSALYMFLHRDSEILYVSQVPPCLLKRVQGPGLPPSPLYLTPLCLVSRMELTPSRRMGEKRGDNVWVICPGSQNIAVTSPMTCSGVFRERKTSS